MSRNTRTIPIRITTFSAAMMKRNVAGDPGADQVGRVVERRAAVLDRTAQGPEPDRKQSGKREHDRRMAEREEEPDAQGSFAIGHQLPRRVVDRRDVIGVEGVTETERVGGEADPDREGAGGAERVVMRRNERDQDEEAERVEPDHDRHHRGDAPPLLGSQRRTHAPPPRCAAAHSGIELTGAPPSIVGCPRTADARNWDTSRRSGSG